MNCCNAIGMFWGMIIGIVGCSLGAWAHTTAMDKDGMLLVDGQRCFILGLYEEAKDEEFAEEVNQAGFNLIRVSPDQESLDRAANFDLQTWIPLGGLAVAPGADETALKTIVETWKSHPAFSIWEAPDEALWNVWWGRLNQANDRWKAVDKAIQVYQGNAEEKETLQQKRSQWHRYRGSARYRQAEEIEESIRKIVGLPPATERLSDWYEHLPELFDQLQNGCKIVRQADSDHVLWFNHAPRNTMADLTRFGTLADVVGCDIYPVPFGPQVGHSDLAERNLTSVGRFTERMGKSVPGKPVWMVLQGFGWEDISEGKSEIERPRPTLAQTRYMAYDAIVNGARGILYWGTAYVDKETQFWEDLKTVVSELHNLEPFLSAPDANSNIQVTLHPFAASDEKGVRWLAKEKDGQWALILVNEADSALAFEISGLDKLNGKTFQVLGDKEELIVENGKVTFGLSSSSVSVLLSK